MNKEQFKQEIRTRLSDYSDEDINKALEFYDEAIDDRMEDGMSEDEAVAAIGTPEEVARQIQMDTPITTLVKNKVKGKGELKTWQVVLIILTAPIWFGLGIALLSIIFSIVVTILSLVFAFMVTMAALIASGVGVFCVSLIALIAGGGLHAVVSAGAALVILGLGILSIIPVMAFARGAIKVIKGFLSWIKSLFVK